MDLDKRKVEALEKIAGAQERQAAALERLLALGERLGESAEELFGMGLEAVKSSPEIQAKLGELAALGEDFGEDLAKQALERRPSETAEAVVETGAEPETAAKVETTH